MMPPAGVENLFWLLAMLCVIAGGLVVAGIVADIVRRIAEWRAWRKRRRFYQGKI